MAGPARRATRRPAAAGDRRGPDYDSSWGGFTGNASAWVIDEHGTVKVTRDYVSSDPGRPGQRLVRDRQGRDGPQGARGAPRREVALALRRQDQPLLDRILNSYSYGKEKVYKSSDAKALVRRYVDWGASIKAFNEDDNAYNAPNGAGRHRRTGGLDQLPEPDRPGHGQRQGLHRTA